MMKVIVVFKHLLDRFRFNFHALPLPLTAPLVAVATDCLDHKSLCYGPKTKTCDDFLTLLQLLRMRNTFKVAVVEVKSEPVY